MFSRSLVFPVLILSLAAFPLYGCSSSSSGAVGSGLPNPALVSDGSGVSSWDVLLVGAETGSEFVLFIGTVPFTDRPFLESWTLSFDSTGVLTIGMRKNNGCIDTVKTTSYTFDGTTGTISGSWLITQTCDGDLSSEGVLSIVLALDTVTDTISGTVSLQLEGLDQFVSPFNSTQIGTIIGIRVPPPPVAPPDPGLVGDWSGLADLLTSGLRAGVDQNNFGADELAGEPAFVDWNINATFDVVGNVVFKINVPGTAPILDPGCQDTITLQYTYDGAVGQIFGAWFLVNDCEGDLVDTGTLIIDFVSDGTTILTTAPSGSFNATSFGTDMNGLPFAETDIDDSPPGGIGVVLLR